MDDSAFASILTLERAPSKQNLDGAPSEERCGLGANHSHLDAIRTMLYRRRFLADDAAIMCGDEYGRANIQA